MEFPSFTQLSWQGRTCWTLIDPTDFKILHLPSITYMARWVGKHSVHTLKFLTHVTQVASCRSFVYHVVPLLPELPLLSSQLPTQPSFDTAFELHPNYSRPRWADNLITNTSSLPSSELCGGALLVSPSPFPTSKPSLSAIQTVALVLLWWKEAFNCHVMNSCYGVSTELCSW